MPLYDGFTAQNTAFYRKTAHKRAVSDPLHGRYTDGEMTYGCRLGRFPPHSADAYRFILRVSDAQNLSRVSFRFAA